MSAICRNRADHTCTGIWFEPGPKISVGVGYEERTHDYSGGYRTLMTKRDKELIEATV